MMRNSELHVRSAIFALLIHVALCALLWWGASWQQNKPTEVEIWDADSLSGTEIEQQAQLTVNEVKTTVIKPEDSAEIETKTQSKTLEKTVTESKTEPNKTVTSKPSPTPQKTIDSKSNILNNALNNGGSKSNGNAGNGSGDIESYRVAVKRMVENGAKAIGGKSAKIAINVSASGQVLGKRVIRSSGDAAWDAKLLSTIVRMPPNPPPAAQGGQLILTISP